MLILSPKRVYKLHFGFASESELNASLNCVYVFVVRQTVDVDAVPSVVKHYLSILVERIVETESGRVDVTTAYACGTCCWPVNEESIGIVLVTTCRVVFTLSEVVETSVIETCYNFKRLAVEAVQHTVELVVSVVVAEDFVASLNVGTIEVVGPNLVG